jgi:hypothetical protein
MWCWLFDSFLLKVKNVWKLASVPLMCSLAMVLRHRNNFTFYCYPILQNCIWSQGLHSPSTLCGITLMNRHVNETERSCMQKRRYNCCNFVLCSLVWLIYKIMANKSANRITISLSRSQS